MSTETVFDNLNKINVSDKTDKKGKFTYLSWVFAWSEVKKRYPNVKTTVYENTLGQPYFADGDAGVMVKVGVTIEEVEHISYLPCMDFSNKAIKASAVNMMDINKAIQRATVKAIGLHGLGLYIYAGEDLPEDDSPSSPVKKKADKVVEKKEVKVVEKKVESKKSGNSFRNSEKPAAAPASVVEEEEM